MSPLVANMRMYGVSEEVGALWTALAEWVATASGVPLVPVAHPPPAPIEELWQRSDMGLVQMCGWPYWRASPRPQLIAAIVPDCPLAGGEPRYWTDLVVAADSPAETLADTFGGRIAYTVPGSHSGFNAPRRLLAALGSRETCPLYAQSVGPVVTPAGAIEAVVSGRCDIAPLDGYFHLLLARHDRARAARIRTIARTEPAPMPPFVASGDAAPEAVSALRDTLLEAWNVPAAARLMDALAIARFAPVEPRDYALTAQWDAEAIALGLRTVR